MICLPCAIIRVKNAEVIPIEPLQYEQRGYLNEPFRLFYLADDHAGDIEYHYHTFHKIILLLAGMLLDAISIYYVFLPFMLPIMAHFHWDPIWFGIMMTVNLAVGQVTPPVAVNLYVGANISGLSMEQISKPALPLIFSALLALVVIVLFPRLSTFLPQLLGLS